MPSLRPLLLVAAVALWSSAAFAAADDDDTFLPPAPPGAASPFPFCPVRPAAVSTLPFPWSPPLPPPSSPRTTVYPQDPGYSEACRVCRGAAWLPLATAVLSAFLIRLY